MLHDWERLVTFVSKRRASFLTPEGLPSGGSIRFFPARKLSDYVGIWGSVREPRFRIANGARLLLATGKETRFRL